MYDYENVHFVITNGYGTCSLQEMVTERPGFLNEKEIIMPVLPKGYEFPPRLEGESLFEYAIRVKTHPSLPREERVTLHPDDVADLDKTEEVIARGYIIMPSPQPGALAQELMDKEGITREEAEARIMEGIDKLVKPDREPDSR